jgi:hypothetical protein
LIVFIGGIHSYAQESILNRKINLDKQNSTIVEVLDELEAKLDFTIGYSDSAINLSKTISVKCENKTLAQVLRNIFPSKLYQFKVLKKKLLIYKRPKKYVVSGYISEKGSQEYLSNVSIYIPELNIGTTSNDDGFYSLSIPEGKHQILISFVGYHHLKKNLNLTANVTINVNLELDTQHLDEVIISSDQQLNKNEITQISSEKLLPSTLESIPVILGEKDVIKTLQLLPGVQSDNQSSSGFYIRGGAPDQNLVILDQATVYNSNHLFGIFSIFNGDVIRSLEIFKGGFPARFGGRLSSVLKIDTKNGNKEKLRGKVNIGLISSSLILEGPIINERTSFVISGRRTYADVLLLPFQSKEHKLSYFFSDVNAKLHHIINDKNKMYWSAYFGEDKYKEKDSNFDGRKSVQSTRWGNITSTLHWNHEFSNKLFLNTSLIFSNYNFSLKNNQEEVSNTSSSVKTNGGINDYGVKFDFNYYPNQDHQFKFGLMSTYHHFTPKEIDIRDSNNNKIAITQKIKTLENGVYIEDDWRISDKISVCLGVRFSHFQHKSKSYFKPEMRFSLAYRLHPTFTVKASYSKMNQYIHRLSNSGLGPPIDLWISSTENLKPQLSEQFVFGLVKGFGTTSYTLTIEGYYKKMEDIITFKEGGTFVSLKSPDEIITSIGAVDFVNGITAGQGWAYGTEVLLRKKKGKLTGWLGYTLSWSQRQFDDLNKGKIFKDRLDRRHDFSLVGIYKPSKKITISANWLFSSGINYTLSNIVGISPENSFPIANDSNENSIQFTTKKNNFKGENTHRLDLGIQFHKITKRNRERIWGISGYNIYARKNPLYYEILKNEENSRNVLYKNYFFQFIPSVNYTLKF